MNQQDAFQLFDIILDRRDSRKEWQLSFEFRDNNRHDWFAGLDIPMGIDRRRAAKALRELADDMERL
jgi:hypothetical protein